MTLPKYHARDYAVQPHPHGEYYRVEDVEPVLKECEEVLDVLVTLIPDIGQLTKVQCLLAQLKETHP